MKKPTLLEQLLKEPYRFEFFQAVRLLQHFHPELATLGNTWSTTPEVVRLRAMPTLAFPPSEVVEYQAAGPDRRFATLTAACFGLYGAGGALPTHYTQLILDLERDVRGPERRALRDWLDIFNHRLASLFYRAWEKYRVAIPFERGAAFAREPDTFTAMLLSFAGLGLPSLRHRFSITTQPVSQNDGVEAITEQPLAQIEDVALLHYTSILAARRPRNAWGLQALLRDYFGIQVQVQQFRGQWLAIPADGLSQLGSTGRLGLDAVAGSHVWNIQGKIRVQLGPLPWDRFVDFLPDRSPIPERKSLFLLMHLIRFYVGLEFDYEVQVQLDRHTVPPARLDSASPLGLRLGWNSWIVDGTPDHDLGDAVFDGEEVHHLAT